MIFVTDKGRMCNNILQYGHVYAWAREHGRKSISMRFCYKYQYFKICHTKGHNFLSYVFAKYAAKWGLMPTVEFNDIAEEAIQRDASLIAKHKHVLVKDGVFVSMISSSSTKPKLSTFFPSMLLF